MNLIAVIDRHSKCFVGKEGRDEHFVLNDNERPVEKIFNEDGGTTLTPEDIGYAISKHRKPNEGIFFAHTDVFDFFTNYEIQ
jgi:hypothetical protein